MIIMNDDNDSISALEQLLTNPSPSPTLVRKSSCSDPEIVIIMVSIIIMRRIIIIIRAMMIIIIKKIRDDNDNEKKTTKKITNPKKFCRRP